MGENPYAAADPLLMRKFGHFRLEKRIGEGGMGAVYLGTDGSREVAIKVLPPQFSTDPEHLERFFREVRVMEAIDHPHVVKVIAAGETDKIYWIAMEYIKGKKLSDVIVEQKRMPFERAARIIREIAKGLAAAHDKGVIHRDVKPQNVLVAPDGRPRVIDFGLAREPGKSKGLTVEGTMMGTPEYMAPEQVEGKQTDRRTDIYSLGVTFYQLISGKLPFGGENGMQMAMARLKEEPRDIRGAFPGVDPRVIPILVKMLQRLPGSRYQTMDELVTEIDKAIGGKGTFQPARKASGGKAVTIDARRRVRVAVMWSLCAAAAGLLFVAGMKAGPHLPEAMKNSAVVTWAGAALGALVLGLLVGVKDLVTARRVMETPLTALVVVAIGGATGMFFDDKTVTGPANRIAIALFLIGVGAMGAFRQWKPILTDVCSLAAALLVFTASTGRALFEPFQAIGGRLEVALPLAIGAIFIPVFGAVLLSGEERKKSTRVLGLLLLLAGCAGLAVFGALTPVGDFRWTGQSAIEALKAVTSGGAALLIALAVSIVGVVRVLSGLEQTDSYYRVK